MDDIELKDMGNDDFNLVVGPVVIELSRSSYVPDFKPVWRWWRVRVNKMTLAATNGRTIGDKKLIRFLEEHLELSS